MKQNKPIIALKRFQWLSLLLLIMPGLVSANTCYDAIDYIKPDQTKPARALYLLIDQTTPLSKDMRQRITQLLEGWGKPGDLIKVAQFSANMQGRFPQVTFNQRAVVKPDEKYLFQLRWKDKNDLLACLEDSKRMYKESLDKAIKTALDGMSSKIPKTELLFSLKELSRQVVLKDEAERQVVVLVSNGMEHSGTMSFYQKGKLKSLSTQKTISQVRRKGLIGYWHGTEVYIYGLGMLENQKAYVTPTSLKLLSDFWERYFVEGGAKVQAIGMPELLLSSID